MLREPYRPLVACTNTFIAPGALSRSSMLSGSCRITPLPDEAVGINDDTLQEIHIRTMGGIVEHRRIDPQATHVC